MECRGLRHLRRVARSDPGLSALMVRIMIMTDARGLDQPSNYVDLLAELKERVPRGPRRSGQ